MKIPVSVTTRRAKPLGVMTMTGARSTLVFAASLSVKSRASTTFIFFTLARIVCAVPFFWWTRDFPATAVLLFFIVCDIYDGRIARHFTVDFPLRRMLDAYVDRSFILVVSCLLACQDPRWWPIVVLLVIRDAILARVLSRAFETRNVVLLGGTPNKAAAWAWAIWAATTFWFGFTELTVAAGLAMIVAKFAVLLNMWAFARDVYCDPHRVIVVDNWNVLRLAKRY